MIEEIFLKIIYVAAWIIVLYALISMQLPDRSKKGKSKGIEQIESRDEQEKRLGELINKSLNK